MVIVAAYSINVDTFTTSGDSSIFACIASRNGTMSVACRSLGGLIGACTPRVVGLVGGSNGLASLNISMSTIYTSRGPVCRLLTRLSPALVRLVDNDGNSSSRIVGTILLSTNTVHSSLTSRSGRETVHLICTRCACLTSSSTTVDV